MTARLAFRSTICHLRESGIETTHIDTERKLYAALARMLGVTLPPGEQPVSRKLTARAIRHYARTGELVVIPTSGGVEDRPARTSKLARERLRQCFEVGDLADSRVGLFSHSLSYRRPTRITLLFERQGGRCHYCGVEMLLGKEHQGDALFATLDHVKPKTRGGIRSGDNSVAACAACNFAKGSQGYDEFVASGEAAA